MRFRELMPDAWVVRDRTHDYGVDFEIEVFSKDEQSTGLVFLAQLKATDSVNSADRVRMTNDQLSYLRTLDAPTAIFRFVSPDNSWRWSWTFDPNVVKASGSGKTTTISFPIDCAWQQGDPDGIETTLTVRRALRSSSPRDRLSLVCVESTPIRTRFEIDAALQSIADDLDCFVIDKSPDPDVALNIDFGIEGDQLRIALDRLASGKIPFNDPGGLKATIVYGLIGVLRGAKLHFHAEMAARMALRQGLTTTLRLLAARAVASLVADPIAAADLAVANGLADTHDPSWVLTYHQLITAPAPRGQRRAAIERLNEAALEAARQSGSARSEAAVRYNMAGCCLDAGDQHGALRHLNSARRLRPAYMRYAYFLTDIGRALFGNGRYRKAAAYYRRAHELEPGPRYKLCLADSLMLGGLLADAHGLYMELHDEVDDATISEVVLKATLCAGLQEELQISIAPAGIAAGEAWDAAATEDMLTNEDDLRLTLRTHDVFNPLASFNLGILRAREGRYQEAIFGFLACGFRQSGDIEAWRNAVLMAINLRDAVMATAVIDCALRFGGAAVRDAVRQELYSQNANEEQIEAWDSVLTTAHQGIGRAHKEVLFRIILGDDQKPFTFSLL